MKDIRLSDRPLGSAKPAIGSFHFRTIGAVLVCSMLLLTMLPHAVQAASDKGQGKGSGGSTTTKGQDNAPPSITAPPDIVAEATGLKTTVSLGQPTVSDNKDPAPTVTNNAPYAGFAIGLTTVTWTATDASGNTAFANQKVTIRDTTAPSITAPPDITTNSTGTLTTVSIGTATASDIIDSSPVVTNNAPSGGFPVGKTTVTWKATDKAGNYATATQLITIVGTQTDNSFEYSPVFQATGSNYFEIPDNAQLRLQKFSLATWFKTSEAVASGTTAIIAAKGGFGSESAGQNMNYGIWMDENEIIVGGFEAGNGANVFAQSKNAYNDGNWHYSVVTYDGQTVRLFIDGQSVASLSSAEKPDATTTQAMRIGSNPVQNDRYFTGEIDEVRVWNTVLSSSDISSQYSAGDFTSNGQLLHMDGTDYETFYDSTGSGSNSLPVANAGSDKTVQEKTTVYLDASASYDPEGSALTFSWSQTAGPSVSLTNGATSTPRFVAPDLGYGTTQLLTFSVTVSDGSGSSNDAVTITVWSTDTQAPTGQVKINGGNIYTKMTSASLSLSCTDTESGCSQMRIAQDGTLDSEIFESFASSKSITLPSGDGIKTVKVTFKDASGNVSPIYSDTITLDTKAPAAPVISSPLTGTTTTNTKPTFSGTAEPNSAVAVYYTTSTSTVTIGSTIASSTGTWSVTAGSDLAAASYSFKAKATDGAGNVSPASNTVTLTISTTTTVIVPGTTVTYTFCASGCNYNNLQTAINALPSTGGTILIKDGTYTWSNTITLKSGTHLEFSSGTTIYFKGSTKPVLSGNGVNNVSIKGGSITADYAGVKAIAFWKSKNIVVDGMKSQLVMGSNSNAFFCQDCIDVHVSNMNAKTATRLIDIKSSSRDATYGQTKNVWIENNVLSGASIEGIKINWGQDIYVIGNKVSNTNDNGIDIGFNINSVVKGNTIINTGIPYGAAIHTDTTDTALVQDNYIDGTGETGITVHKATKVDVIGNTIKNAGKEGINIIDSTIPSSYVNIKYNHIIAPDMEGIYQSPNQSYVEIAHNTLENIPSAYQAIRVVWSNNPTTTVHDNTVI